jgi:MYXO-CTERM domain-containing protein
VNLARLQPVLVVTPLLVFGVLAALVALGDSVPGDRTIYRRLVRYEDKHPIAGVADFLASRTIEIGAALLIAAVLLALAARGRVGAAAFIAASLVPAALVPALKGAFDRQPPEVHPAHGGSFPSGHATGSMAVAAAAVALAWPTRRRRSVAVVGGLLVVAVGLAAVVAGDHWPSDVVAGWSLALAWVSALHASRNRVRPSGP